MAAKKPDKAPEKPKPSALDANKPQKQWNSFSGSSGLPPVENIAKVGKHTTAEFSVASYASAARARRMSTEVVATDDALSHFRNTGNWDAPQLIAAMMQEPVDAEPVKKRRPKRNADPEGMVSAARVMVALSVFGGVKGIRDLTTSLMQIDTIDTDVRRKVEGINRSIGGRNLSIEQLRELVKLCCMALPLDEDDTLTDRASRLVDVRGGLRIIGDPQNSTSSPRQLLDVRSQEACMVVVDMPKGKMAASRRAPGFTRVVGLLRDIKNELTLVDPFGIYDPAKGADDKSLHHVVMRKPDEMALRDFLAGVSDTLPTSPLARLTWNGYLSSVPPKSFASLENSVLRGSTFRYA